MTCLVWMVCISGLGHVYRSCILADHRVETCTDDTDRTSSDYNVLTNPGSRVMFWPHPVDRYNETCTDHSDHVDQPLRNLYRWFRPIKIVSSRCTWSNRCIQHVLCIWPVPLEYYRVLHWAFCLHVGSNITSVAHATTHAACGLICLACDVSK